MARGRAGKRGHGDYGYARRLGCDCIPCRDAVRRYAKGLNYDLDRGFRRTVVAGPIRVHVQGLVDGGATAWRISQVSGVTAAQVTRLLFGNPTKNLAPVERMHAHTARKLLAVTLSETTPVRGFTSSLGTHRRIRALAARSFSKEDIGAELGISGSAVHGWMGRDIITVEVAEKMKGAYDRMCMREGVSETMRWRALRLDWPPPLAWDDDTIDDPNAEPARTSLRCVVASCPREVAVASLCRHHHATVTRGGGFKSSRQFRAAVQRINGTR